jgi:D-glycero-alpha-D-manno-heptose-7-phosphate kinase
MHQVKASSYKIKELLFKADIAGLAKEFQTSWLAKKSTSSSITNSLIDDIERDILKSGALAMKVSGAGGGGFIMILVEPEKKLDVLASLDKYDGRAHKFQFTNEGAYSWTI